ncbi:OsmC family protein [Ancylomarina longa]|uniref:OsmC family peroxiredoxin n=1 Tax=Ancylomarina longa TaxID=2487017 RepID=A0A434AFL7_9BACT|nr:OsmC family protein [Ancylomarina longa]RUT73160.1 OsmC family peroxiredoxin [Ancylomarina longa]
MKHKVEMKWLGNLAYKSEMDGHTLITDATVQVGGDGKGVSPKKLMLTALAGCTGIDMALILKKMRVEVEDIKVSVEGELTEEKPSYYKNMHVIYEFFGKELLHQKIERAVKLSEEEYCGVSALYKQVISVTSEIIYHED